MNVFLQSSGVNGVMKTITSRHETYIALEISIAMFFSVIAAMFAIVIVALLFWLRF